MPERPRVSVGLPVHDGQRYLADTLDGLLGQTFADLEVVICDNASTDATPRICAAYAARDERIRYVRQPRNVGAAANYNRAFELSRGQLFKWAAHDDICRPRFLEACVDALDAADGDGIVLVHPRAVLIDADGTFLRADHDDIALDDPDPAARFAHVLAHVRAANAVFGVFRREALAATSRIAPYPGSDWMLLAEIALQGRIHRLDEVLFERRIHEDASLRAIQIRGGGRRAEVTWFAGRGTGITPWIPFDVHSSVVLARAALRAPYPLIQRLSALSMIPRTYWPRLARFRGGRLVKRLRGDPVKGPTPIAREG